MQHTNLQGIMNYQDMLAIFQNAGYMGLYGGLDVDDIHTRKQLEVGQKILDYMGSTELIANLFRISQTEEKEMGNCLFMYGHFCLCLCNYFNNRYSVSRN